MKVYVLYRNIEGYPSSMGAYFTKDKAMAAADAEAEDMWEVSYAKMGFKWRHKPEGMVDTWTVNFISYMDSSEDDPNDPDRAWHYGIEEFEVIE